MWGGSRGERTGSFAEGRDSSASGRPSASAYRGMDSSLFFPARGELTTAAKSVCESCQVRYECLESSLTTPAEKFGIWGGLSERERRRVRQAGNAARRRLAS